MVDGIVKRGLFSLPENAAGRSTTVETADTVNPFLLDNRTHDRSRARRCNAEVERNWPLNGDVLLGKLANVHLSCALAFAPMGMFTLLEYICIVDTSFELQAKNIAFLSAEQIYGTRFNLVL